MTFSKQEMYRPIFERKGSKKWCDEEKDRWNREATIGGDNNLRQLRLTVGGKKTKDFCEIAIEYHNAAEALIDAIRSNPTSVPEYGNVILYLYRHSIELILKDILPAELLEKNHKFGQLADRFQSMILDDFDNAVPDWIPQRIMEFAKIDPASTTFRYNQHTAFVSGPTYLIDVAHLRAAMNALNTALMGARAVIKLEGSSAKND